MLTWHLFFFAHSTQDANLPPKEACQFCVGNTENSCAVDARDSFYVNAYCCSHLMSGPFALPMLKAFGFLIMVVHC
ncbi:unnamed protein product [Camellia sinensis]